MSQLIKAVIADDEPILRAHLKMMLEEAWPELDIVGQAADGEEALTLVEAFSPQVVFLDINMPGIDGLEVSRQLCEQAQPPYVVFITAYDEHAVVAFENQAIDYLLKPIEEPRLERTVERLQKLLNQQSPELNQKAQLGEIFEELLESAQSAATGNYLKWIKASKNNELHVVNVSDIDYFIADNKYTEIHTAKGTYLIKTAITALENELDPEMFWRIHRNCIVKVEKIQRVTKDELGHVYVDLKDSDDRLAVSRKYQALFKQM
ncbi:LytR/AlgR family response regulator transcription factor [Pseudoalteromonas piscicida]|uniref:DNA-binding response regulator n=1 Tax=Pseudoalteromonas piscicida TaxID=43662 RepID=A0AAD0RLC5_PSEO7|nr:LytTR family DNA-binding domain-containing protein [Pseudoalteromonas piscicida]ASD68791.1 DNA-binding response regulator [Pseudoalteromonas piscicida]AXQ99534.1 DNA-binding response regulator [Pseudoalteromonas piscicida]AXR03850.1 DNA-binding response regulator [Pseudoalteromonas piscicida]